jgi:hypothetical protein
MMYLVHYLDQYTYDQPMSLHSTRAAAEAAFEALLRQYIVKDGEPLPPKEDWGVLHDVHGESVRLYKIECDGGPAEEINLSEDLATA